MISKTTEAITATEEKALQQILERIDNAKLGIVTSSVAIGAALCDARKILGRGLNGWIEANCTFGRTTAYNHMAAFECFGNCSNFEHFDDTAMYLLAKCSPAADEAKALANRGKRITHTLAHELVRKHKSRDGEVRGEEDGGTVEAVSVNPYELPDKDPNGLPIPEKFVSIWEHQRAFRSLAQKLTEVLKEMDELRKIPAGMLLNEQFTHIKMDIENARRGINFVMPYQVCPYCKGKCCERKKGDLTTPCRGTGWAGKGIKGPGK